MSNQRIKQVLREVAIIASVAESLGAESVTDLDGLITEQEVEVLRPLIESIPEDEETEALAEETARVILREAVDRLLALVEVTQPAAEN